MLIKWVADYKYKAIADFIHAMYKYHPDLDVYIPHYGVIDGKAMRTVIDLTSGRSLAYGLDVHDEQMLISEE